MLHFLFRIPPPYPSWPAYILLAFKPQLKCANSWKSSLMASAGQLGSDAHATINTLPLHQSFTGCASAPSSRLWIPWRQAQVCSVATSPGLCVLLVFISVSHWLIFCLKIGSIFSLGSWEVSTRGCDFIVELSWAPPAICPTLFVGPGPFSFSY